MKELLLSGKGGDVRPRKAMENTQRQKRREGRTSRITSAVVARASRTRVQIPRGDALVPLPQPFFVLWLSLPFCVTVVLFLTSRALG